MTHNASDRKSIRKAEKAARQEELLTAAVITNLMSSPNGRRYIWAKLSAAHIFHTSFTIDPLQMAFNEGERNAGLQLLNEIMLHCPDQFTQAMREANERNTPDERARNEDTDGRDQGPRAEADSGDEDGGEEAGAGEEAGGYRHPSFDGEAIIRRQ